MGARGRERSERSTRGMEPQMRLMRRCLSLVDWRKVRKIWRWVAQSHSVHGMEEHASESRSDVRKLSFAHAYGESEYSMTNERIVGLERRLILRHARYLRGE